MTFETGKKWCARGGMVVMVTGGNSWSEYPVNGYLVDDPGRRMLFWRASGHYIGPRDPTPLDLLVEVENEKPDWGLPANVLPAIELAVRFGGIEGDRHRAWVIDQMVRELTGDRYDEVITWACGTDYTWDVGIAP